MLRVRLLGGVELRLGEQRLEPLGSARAESLLAYLLLHRDAAQSRQRLAFMLWPDSTEAQARTNLRHLLHNLRGALPDPDRFLEVGPRTLQWRPDAPLWLDVAAFEAALADGRLADAVEAYAGELLEGNYDEWLLEERERLADLQLEALERLARELEERCEWADAIRHAERLLRGDPLREESYRLLMRLHGGAGDRARALRCYHVCETTLERELGVSPSARTREAYAALLPAAVETAPERVGKAPAAAPLVGRAAERARLTELWRAAERGGAQLVLVTGEAGIGKSRLVEELRSWCAHRGAVTAEARAYAAEGAIAYATLTAWLRSEAIAPRVRRLDAARRSELARLLPELLAEAAELPAPEPLPEAEQRQRLFAALRAALTDAGGPLLLVADDLQWCDEQTLQFLHYLLRSEPEGPLLVAATARREEIDPGDPVSDLLAALQSLGRFWEIPLERLSRQETGLLAERIAGRALAGADADRLHDESEGNPLFVIEALRAAPGTGAAEPGPGRVQAVISSRLARLSEPAAELVGVAATIGREFTTQLLADAGAVDEQGLVGGLDELWRRGLVRAHGPSAYDFSHGKIREAAYQALGPAQARHNHLQVADALRGGRSGAELDAVASQIAAHYEAAGAAAEAVAWYERAADAAQRLYASAEAVRLLERALDLGGDLPDRADRDARELELLTALPAPLFSLEGYSSTRLVEVHKRALGLAGALGVEPEPPLVRSLALAALTRGELEAARPFGEQLRARAEQEGDEVLWVESGYVLGLVEYWQGRLEPAVVHFEGAVQRCRPEQVTAHLLRYGQDPESVCGMRMAHALWLLGRDEASERAREAALAGAERSSHPYSLSIAHTWAGVIAIDQHDERRVRLHLRSLKGLDLGAVPQFELAIGAFGGLLDVLDGEAESGVERVRRTLEEVRADPPAPGASGLMARTLVEACSLAGANEDGLAAAEEALTLGGAAQLWEAELRRLRAELLWRLGGPNEEVEAELERALEVAERQGARAYERRARRSIDRLRAGTRGGTLTERSVPEDGARELWLAST